MAANVISHLMEIITVSTESESSGEAIPPNDVMRLLQQAYNRWRRQNYHTCLNPRDLTWNSTDGRMVFFYDLQEDSSFRGFEVAASNGQMTKNGKHEY